MKKLEDIFRIFFMPDDGAGEGGGGHGGSDGNGEGSEGADGGDNGGSGDGEGNNDGAGNHVGNDGGTDAGNKGDGSNGNQGDGSGEGTDGKPVKSILDDSGEGEGEGEGSRSDGQDDNKNLPTPEAVAEYVSGIKITDKDGNDLKVDQDAINFLAPMLMKHNLDKDAAGELIQQYANYATKKVAEGLKKHNDGLEQMTNQLKEEFGKDLPRFAKEANAGGKAIFGEQGWNWLKSIPEFCNQAFVIKGLAEVGRSIGNDTGTGGDGGRDSEQGFSAEGWAKRSNAIGRGTE